MKTPILQNIMTGRNCAFLSFNENNILVLVSYNNPVAAIINRNSPLETVSCVIEKVPSKTTQKHINLFMEYYGFEEEKHVFTNEAELYDLMAGK